MRFTSGPFNKPPPTRDLNPLYVDHTINLARFHQPGLPVDTPSKTQLVDLGDRYYVQVQRFRPNSVTRWNERANFDLTSRNDPDAALQKLHESWARDPQFAQTYLYLGTAYAQKHEYHQAVQDYQKALALDASQTGAQSKLAFVHYQQGEVSDSIDAYQKYVELAPGAQNLFEAHKNLAPPCLQTGDREKAIQEGQFATNLAPAIYTCAGRKPHPSSV